jgi:hypothetical protein
LIARCMVPLCAGLRKRTERERQDPGGMDDRASGEGGPGELRLALLATSRRAGSGACMRSQSPDQMRCFVRVSCSPAPPATASPHFLQMLLPRYLRWCAARAFLELVTTDDSPPLLSIGSPLHPAATTTCTDATTTTSVAASCSSS